MTEIEIKRNELKAVMFQNMNAVAVREALIILEDLEDMLVKTCNEPHVSKSEGIERETSCKHSDWIDLYYSSGDLYGRYCNDCGEFFE